jgi:hypothetical protein
MSQLVCYRIGCTKCLAFNFHYFFPSSSADIFSAFFWCFIGGKNFGSNLLWLLELSGKFVELDRLMPLCRTLMLHFSGKFIWKSREKRKKHMSIVGEKNWTIFYFAFWWSARIQWNFPGVKIDAFFMKIGLLPWKTILKWFEQHNWRQRKKIIIELRSFKVRVRN